MNKIPSNKPAASSQGIKQGCHRNIAWPIDCRISAFAGCGKTETLRLLAEAFPGVRFLYLCFNK